jgi:asparagine synthase (glutamine-hydrolysing)
MCGIWGLLGDVYSKEQAESLLKNLSARGPEGARMIEDKNFQLGFTRLAINGLEPSGMQPMTNTKKNLVWVCNGEIYNWKDLAKRHSIDVSGSDCSVLGPLFETLGTQTDIKTLFQSLDGVFAMIVIDITAGIAFVGRDPYGIRPLFVGYTLGEPVQSVKDRMCITDSSGKLRPVVRIKFSSELKALNLGDCTIVEAFPPGHYAAYNIKTLQRIGFEAYHTVPWLKNPDYEDCEGSLDALSKSLKVAVKKRMMMERPVAALLSGGLDSSLIAALVQKELKEAGKPPLKTFSIGFEGSQDLKYARIAADHIFSDHTEIIMTPDDFFAAIPEVIQSIESFDITTVRASVGNWLVSREIARRTDCKVVFNGDGSDEVFGGYMYFYNAPSDEAFEAETSRLLKDIHLFDVLRSDRCISSHGLEPRTPFLDKQFVAVAKSLATSIRRPVKDRINEKQILRSAFMMTNLLPECVILRKKEAFSDGVSGKIKSWYEECQERALAEVGPDWEQKAKMFTHLTPKTAEAYYYRVLFNRYYGSAEQCVVPYHWMPRWTPGATDPSARTIEAYNTTK